MPISLLSLRFLTLGLALVLTAGSALAAGNVLVYVRSGSLQVLADDDDNAVRVYAGDDPEEFVVESLDGVTTINSSLDPFTAVNVGRNVRIDLQDGNDTLVVEDVTVVFDLEILGAKGTDSVDVNDVQVGKNTRIATGQDDDTVVVSTVTLGGKLTIQSEQGNDDITVDLASVAGRTKISTGLDLDGVALGGGSTFLDTVSVTSSSGNDTVVVDDATFARKFGVILGDDNDVVSLTSGTFQLIVDLNGGDGVDTRLDGGGNSFTIAPFLRKIENLL